MVATLTLGLGATPAKAILFGEDVLSAAGITWQKAKLVKYL
jgi:hypothetical protein